MRFLLDVGISPRLGKLLEADGHDFRYVPKGAFVVIEEYSVRIRVLPIGD